MGSFNVACSVSRLSINAGDHIAFIPLERSEYQDSNLANGDHMLIYTNCFYSPATLPIFGEYDDYGGTEVLKDKNTEILEKYFECDIQDIVSVDNKPKPISSGMFVHAKVYHRLVTAQTNEWGNTSGYEVLTREQCLATLQKAIEQLLEEQEEQEKYDYLAEKKDPSDIELELIKIRKRINSLGRKTHFFNDEYIVLNRIYRPHLIDNNLHSTLQEQMIDFRLFGKALYQSNNFYFPAMNGAQCGNNFVSKKLYDVSLEVTNKNILDRRLGEIDDLKWEHKNKHIIGLMGDE